jgi:hypothetical protein
MGYDVLMSCVTHGPSASEARAPHAAAQLLPLVCDELRQLAAAKMPWREQLAGKDDGCRGYEQGRMTDVEVLSHEGSGMAVEQHLHHLLLELFGVDTARRDAEAARVPRIKSAAVNRYVKALKRLEGVLQGMPGGSEGMGG